MPQQRFYSVFVGGVEVNDHLFRSEGEAEALADWYREEGYDDVAVVDTSDDLIW